MNETRLHSQHPTSSIDHRTGITLLILAVATALKASWALNSAGSLDIVIFWSFAKHLQTDSLKHMYVTYSAFNHTPFTAFTIRTLCWLADGHYFRFAAAFRFLSIFADIGLVLGLLHVKKLTGRPPWWAIYAFAISPVSIIISGFHGNMDPIMVLLMFFAGIAVLHDRPAWSGVLLAAAFNIKVVPILLTPAFFFYWWARGFKQARAFTIANVAGFLIGAAVPLVQCPLAYLSNVLAYGSVAGVWGVTFWLRMTGLECFQRIDFRQLSWEQNVAMTTLKVIMIGSILFFAWHCRKKTGAEFFATLGIVWTLVFVFAPGAVVQYMPWFAPFVLLLAPRWWAALTVASTVFMCSYYHPASEYHFPWDLAHPTAEVSSPWSNLPWALFIGPLVFLARKTWQESREPGVTPPAPAMIEREAVAV